MHLTWNFLINQRIPDQLNLVNKETNKGGNLRPSVPRVFRLPIAVCMSTAKYTHKKAAPGGTAFNEIQQNV
jgi:hypothetical protein